MLCIVTYGKFPSQQVKLHIEQKGHTVVILRNLRDRATPHVVLDSVCMKVQSGYGYNGTPMCKTFDSSAPALTHHYRRVVRFCPAIGACSIHPDVDVDNARNGDVEVVQRARRSDRFSPDGCSQTSDDCTQCVAWRTVRGTC